MSLGYVIKTKPASRARRLTSLGGGVNPDGSACEGSEGGGFKQLHIPCRITTPLEDELQDATT